MFGVGKKFDGTKSENSALRPIQKKNIESNLLDLSPSSFSDLNSPENIMQISNDIMKSIPKLKKSPISISNTDNKQCICDRNSSTIFCAACEKFSFGRVKMACPIHYNVHYLLDFAHCCHCKASWYMMQEIDVDYNKVLEIENAKKKVIVDTQESMAAHKLNIE